MDYDSEAETRKHIQRVGELIGDAIKDLIDRSKYHDRSKLGPVEKPLFDKYTPLLKNVEYNSPKYKELLKDLKPALDNHYANCSHHPEHFKNGIEDMNLLDILEMLLDWKASSERNKGGNIRKSIEINAERFGINPQLRKIFENTCDLFRW